MRWLIIQNRKKPFTVDYTGFGWVMIRKGVFENKEMTYPWFNRRYRCLNRGLFKTCVERTFRSVSMPLSRL